MRLQQAGLSHWSIGIFGENNEAPPHPLIAMSGSYIHTLRYFSGFWARRATPDRVLKILAGGYFDIKRGHSALQVSLSGSLDIWAMWEYRRPRRFRRVLPGGRGPPGRGVALGQCYTQMGLFRLSGLPSVGNKKTATGAVSYQQVGLTVWLPSPARIHSGLDVAG